MEKIQQGVLIAHTLIALGIIALVLLQRGKGADAGAGFGAGASGTVFGARGAGSFFSRATAVLATAFFASSLTLAYLSAQRVSEPDLLIEETQVIEEQADAVPDIADEIPADDVPALEPAEIDSDLPSLAEDPVEDSGNPE